MSASQARWGEDLDVSFYAESAVTIPGMGSPGSGCGEWFPREFCEECGEPHFGESQCGNRGCPECWRIWRGDRAQSIVERLAAARYAESGMGKRAVHGVFSPPEGEVRTLEQLKRARKRAYRLAEEHGIRGGMVIAHGFRITEAVKQEYRQEGGEDASEWGAWHYVREEYGENWRQATYWSPHFHILGLCRDFKATDPEGDDGWVCLNLSSGSSLPKFRLTEREGYEAMARVVTYLLSHLTFQPDQQSHAITWYGELANNKFSPEEAVSPGVLQTIERYAEEVCGVSGDDLDQEAGEEAGEPERCERKGCNGALQPIWDAGMALTDRTFTERIEPEAEERLRAAWEWVCGDREPPPGMKAPQSEEQAEEVLAVLVGDVEPPTGPRDGVLAR